jgi:hypothetical protein
VYPYAAYLALLQALALQAGIPLIDDCSESARVLTDLAANASVDVRSSIAGAKKVCYAVTAVVDGKTIRGYVLGNDLDAVAEFERQRAAAAASIVNIDPAVPSRPKTPDAATTPVAPVEKPHFPPFPDFSATDMNGRPVSAHSLKGKVNLVCFWSPRHQSASRELLVVSRLYGQFKNQGVDALAVSLSGDRGVLKDALDDFHLSFRNVANGYAIAPRYNLDYESLPRTYVLNDRFEVITSALHGKALEDLVKNLVASK